MTTKICGCNGITLSSNAAITLASGQPQSISLIDTASNAVINSTALQIQNTSSTFSITPCRITFADGTYMKGTCAVGALGMTSPTNTQTFTSSGTWVKPGSGRFVIVRLWGGGGSGGAMSNSTSACAVLTAYGGGGGAFHEAVFNMACLTANVTVTVGAGGAGVSVNSGSAAAGLTGGNTSFGCYLKTYGGGGGNNSAYGTGGGSGSSGGRGCGSNGAAASNINEIIIPFRSFGLSNSTSNSTGVTSNVQFIYGFANPRNEFGMNNPFGSSNSSTYGGGAGSCSLWAAGSSTWGGAGGGGAYRKGCTTGTGNGGVSTYGGNGSNGTTTYPGKPGVAPGGGSGGNVTKTANAASGKGGDGRAEVYVY